MKVKKEQVQKYVWEPTLYVFHIGMALAGLRQFQDKQDKKFKEVKPLCTACGGTMEYVKDDKSGSDEKVLLKCTKCDFVRDLRAETVKPKTLSSYFDIRKQDQGLYTKDDVYVSEKGRLPANQPNQTCSAQIVIHNEAQSTTICPFCGGELKRKKAEKDTKKPWSDKGPEETVLTPKGIIPFSVSFEEVKDLFQEWLREDTFLSPSLLKDIIKEHAITGIYIPYFYLKDAKIRVSWYLAPEVEDRGKEKSKEDRIYFSSGYFETQSGNLLSSASSGISNDVLSQINDYEMGELVDFAPGYFEGWSYELNTSNLDKTLKKWQKDKINKGVSGEVKKRVYSRRPEELKIQSEVYDMDLRHVLLPVWVTLYTYKDKPYHFVVNGQTGTVYGSKPKSTRKIFLLITVIISTIIGLVVLADYFWHG